MKNIVKTYILAGAAGLALGTPLQGATAQSAKSPHPNIVSCTLIKTAAQLQAIKNNVTASYCLANDIDLSSIANFKPIGTNSPFTGKLFGNNHVISNLTITTSGQQTGLFALAGDAVIQDVGLTNVKISVKLTNGMSAVVGGLVASASGGPTGTAISNVYVTGKIACSSNGGCEVGGIVGTAVVAGNSIVESWSSAAITSSGNSSAGGLVGFNGALGTPTIDRSYATGSVTCGASCLAGGLVGGNNGLVTRSFATGMVNVGASANGGGLVGENLANGVVQHSYAVGAVSGETGTHVGGLIGWNDSGTVKQSFAAGPVAAGVFSDTGGLIGLANAGTISETYAVGPVAGSAATTGGLIGSATGGPTITLAFWDKQTTGQATSQGAGATASTTAAAQAALPSGWSNVWAITKGRSYPFLNDFDIDFTSPLATVVLSNKIYDSLPINQLDVLQYQGKPKHDDQAALAAVYTMIAREIGITDGVALLKNVKINKYFWHDASETTTWTGPVTAHATLGALKPLPGAISGQNVIAHIKVHHLVIVRGTYTKSTGGTATHWLLATLVTAKPNGIITTLVANDPWTGWQVEIDPATKTVISPSNFPLKNFKVNAYQPVTLH